MWNCEHFEYGWPQIFQKTQISQLKIDDARAALSKRGLDSSGSRLKLQMRLRQAIHPDLSSQSDITCVSNSSQGVSSSDVLLQLKQGAVYKRIPKASRLPACFAFTKVLQNVIHKNDIQAWAKLFNFQDTKKLMI